MDHDCECGLVECADWRLALPNERTGPVPNSQRVAAAFRLLVPLSKLLLPQYRFVD